MELDHFLHKIQGVLKNEERLLGPLYSVRFDNENDVRKVAEALQKAIGSEELNNKTQQKLFLLLFINTDLEIYNDLKKNKKYTHLVGFLPKISRDLFLKIVIELKLQKFLYESIRYFSSPLTYQVLGMCLNALNWFDLFEAVSFVENIITSLFAKIAVTDESDRYNLHLKDLFQRFLLHYDPEKGGSIKRMRLWKKPKLKHYAGLVMASLFDLLEKCTRLYCRKEIFSNESNRDLYNIHIEKEIVELKPVSGLENNLITVQQCYEYVVSKCHENVCAISVDIWMYWVEIELDDIPETENTLQRTIGEKAHFCRETLKEAESLGVASKEGAEVISKIKNFALKPRTNEFEQSSLDLDKIIENIKNPEKDTKQWLRYLVNNSAFLTEPAALEILKTHILMISNEDIIKLSTYLFNYIKSNKNCELYKVFILDFVKCLDIDSQMEVSKCFVEICGVTDILKKEEFHLMLVEIFNKVINEEDKEKELYPRFLNLALQSAEAVVSRAVAEGITSEVRGHLMADILGKLQPFCDAVLPDGKLLLVSALDELLLKLTELSENCQKNYPLFVRELVMRKNLNGEQFIKDCLMVNLHLNMKNKNWVALIACVETLSELFDIDCIHDGPASIVMLLQVVEFNRWQPTNFSMEAVRVCDLALELVDQFVTKCMDTATEGKKLKNLSDLVYHLISPVNRYHLYRLLINEPVPSDPALQLLYRMHFGIGEWSVQQISSQERSKLVYELCFVLPLLTSNEWQELFCVIAPKCSEFLSLFHIVTDSILVCLDSARGNSDNTVISCLSFAILNIAQAVKYEVNRWTKEDNEYRISVLSKMCQLLSILPPSNQETFGMTLIKVLQQLLPEGSRRKPLTAEEMNSVTVSIASIKASAVRQNLAKEFLEMVHR